MPLDAAPRVLHPSSHLIQRIAGVASARRCGIVVRMTAACRRQGAPLRSLYLRAPVSRPMAVRSR